MNILFIVHRIPYPPNKGDKIRSFNEIKYLSKKHNLYLAFLVDDVRDIAHIDELKKYCVDLDYDIINPRWQKIKSMPYLLTDKPLSVPYFYSRKLQEAIDSRLVESGIDTIICFSSPMAEYVFKSRQVELKRQNRLDRSNSKIKLIMDFVDVDSDKWGMYAAFRSFPFSIIYRREWRRLMSYEQMVGLVFDKSIFVSEKEVELFKSFCPDAHTLSIPNGVDLELFESLNQSKELNKLSQKKQSNQNRANILFMGAMDYFPNEDAVLYFSSEIWPCVRREMPRAKFYVVGGKPSRKVRMLPKKDPNIVVTGYVPDVRPYLKMADVFVAPLRIARGVQNKVLEAMAAGVPVVARPEAVQGIRGLNGCVKIEESNESFVLSILKILKTPQEKYKMASDSKRFILDNYDWEENLREMDNILSEESQPTKNKNGIITAHY